MSAPALLPAGTTPRPPNRAQSPPKRAQSLPGTTPPRRRPKTPRAAGRHRCRRKSNPNRRKHPQKPDRKSTRLNSSHVAISYAVFCLKKKKPAEVARGPFGIRRALGDRARRRASGASSAERVNDAARGVAARHGIVLIVLAVICLRHP